METVMYSLADLLALKEEYLATLDDKNEDDWYTTARNSAKSELGDFFLWLNIRNNTP